MLEPGSIRGENAKFKAVISTMHTVGKQQGRFSRIITDRVRWLLDSMVCTCSECASPIRAMLSQ